MKVNANYVQKVTSILKDYKLLGSTNEIMDNDDVPIELKYFINGARYIYMNSMIENIKKTDLVIYPTGSNKLSSDKDIQISIDIEKYSNIKLLVKIIKDVLKQLAIQINNGNIRILKST